VNPSAVYSVYSTGNKIKTNQSMTWHGMKTWTYTYTTSGYRKRYLTETHGKHEGLNTQTNDKTRDTCEQ